MTPPDLSSLHLALHREAGAFSFESANCPTLSFVKARWSLVNICLWSVFPAIIQPSFVRGVKMKIIIIGDGKVGYNLAENLSKEDNDVVIIDKDPEALKKAGE